MTIELDAWIDELATALDVDPAAVDQELLLDVSHAAAKRLAVAHRDPEA